MSPRIISRSKGGSESFRQGGKKIEAHWEGNDLKKRNFRRVRKETSALAILLGEEARKPEMLLGKFNYPAAGLHVTSHNKGGRPLLARSLKGSSGPFPKRILLRFSRRNLPRPKGFLRREMSVKESGNF